VPGAATPVGEARPGWKVLRVLGNLLNLPGFDYTSSDQITEEVRKQLEAAPAFALKASARTLQSKLALAGADSVPRDVPIYSVDALVRRSSALQATSEARGTQPGRRS
jgi:NADH-quinone oxidoreductase subunit G